jgi:predicted dehydrogenase
MPEQARAARIAVVGTGWWAVEHHLPALTDHPHAQLVAVADPNAEKLAVVAQKFGIEHTYTSAQDLFASGTVDSVIVATPHATHYEIVRDALDHGLHVLVEKPMVLRSDHAWDLVAQAERAQRHLSVGYTFQFTRAARRLRDVLQSGEIGDLLAISGLYASIVEAYYRGRPDDYAEAFGFSLGGPDPRTYADPEVSGGGQAVTQLTHAIGLVLYVTGLSPRRVTALMGSADLAVDLVDAVAYELDGGVVGTITSTGSLQPGQDLQQELRFYGTRGHAVLDLVGARLRIVRNEGEVEQVEPTPGESAYPAAAPACCFVDLVTAGAANLGPPLPAARAVEFVEACYTSARSGQVVTTSGR